MRPSQPVPSLRRLRALRGLSQRTLATKAGISRETVGRLERGHEQAVQDTRVRLAAALGCNEDDLADPDSAERIYQTNTVVLKLTALLQESLDRERQIRDLLTALTP